MLVTPVPAPLGVGLIGLGSIGRTHAAVLQDRSAGLPFALRAAAELGPRPADAAYDVVRDYRQLLAMPDVAVVTVATPPDTHHRIAAEALEAGKHVLLEKPPTLTVTDTAALLRLAERRGRCVHVAMHARHGPAAREARRVLEGETLASFRVLYREDVDSYHPGSSWVFDARRSGGGVVMDSGINALSVLVACMGNAAMRVVRATTSALYRGVETRAHIELSWDGGGVGVVDLDWRAAGPETRSFLLTTRSGRELDLDLVRQSLVVDGHAVVPGDRGRDRVHQEEEYVDVYRHYAEALAAGRSEVGLHEMTLVEQAYRAAGRLL